MKRPFRRVMYAAATTCLLSGSLLLTTTPAQAATWYDLYLTTPAGYDFTCVMTKFEGGKTASLEARGAGNAETHVGLVSADPGQALTFEVTEGQKTGDSCSSGVIAQGSTTAPTEGKEIRLILTAALTR